MKVYIAIQPSTKNNEPAILGVFSDENKANECANDPKVEFGKVITKELQ